MKISLNWLSDYVELPSSVEDLATILTMAGLEVEGIERLGQNLGGIVVGRIVSSSPHPRAEKLSVTQVETGRGPMQVVCGAKNFRVGDLVPLATVGSVLPSGQKIEKAILRGVDSFGMLCSAKELSISEENSGLLILEQSANIVIGQPIADALNLADVVLEINVTPNRPDCLSHLGIAREVAALTGKEIRPPDISVAESSSSQAKDLIRVQIDDFELCPRYAARVIEGMQIGPSPYWMQNRLRAVGVRALSNAVDITNYVMLECGQPLHAFDLDLVEGNIVVRRAHDQEKLVTLDGKERILSKDDLCICDSKKPSAIAGIMGGEVSEVSASTKNILLESACFSPVGIRRTARRHGLHSESSFRFERGIDPEMVVFAQDRAAKLFASFGHGQVAGGRVEARKEGPIQKKSVVSLRYQRVGDLLGIPVTKETTVRVLKSLGFSLDSNELEEEKVLVEAPSWRMDVEGEADCIEEIARFIGYSQIPPAVPRGTEQLTHQSKVSIVEEKARFALAASGFDEVVNYSFAAYDELKLLLPGIEPITLKKPLAADQAAMCTTRWAGLIANLKRSSNRQVEDVRLYEIGRVYKPLESSTLDKLDRSRVASEQLVVSGIMFGNRAPLQWGLARAPIDFYDLKGVIEQIFETARISKLTFEQAASVASLHPLSACQVLRRVSGGEQQEIGVLGEIHPLVAKKLDLPSGVFVFELSLEVMASLAQEKRPYRSIPRFPAVLRDLAVVLRESVSACDVETAIREAGEGLVEEVILFDVFRGKSIPEHHKSLAYAIRLRAVERTLTEDETAHVQQKIVNMLEQRFGAQLRSRSV